MGSINASIVANFFLKKAFKQKKSISPMKLIKLVYISSGWCLAALDYDILYAEQIEVWKYGPVIPSLYHEFKRFSKNNIDCFSIDLLEEEASGFLTKSRFIENMQCNIKDRIIVIMQTVWDSYKEYSAWGLTQKTTEIGSPWDQANKSKFKIIEKKKIKKYYVDFIENF